jgi:hypothetical protein
VPDKVYRGGSVHSPPGMHRDRSQTLPRAEPKADSLPVQRERARGTALVHRPGRASKHRPMRHTDRGQVEYGSQMQGQSRSPRVVAPSRVEEQYVWTLRQAAHGRLHQRAYPQRQQPWFIPPTGTTGNDMTSDEPIAAYQHRRRPGRVTCLPGPIVFLLERHKAAAHHRVASWRLPRGWRLNSQRALDFHKLVWCLRPLRHMPQRGRRPESFAARQPTEAFRMRRSSDAGAECCHKQEAEVFPPVACPTPNLGSGAHAAGVSEAKGAQPSGSSAAPFGSRPRERESLGRGVTKEVRDDQGEVVQAPGSRAHVQDR